MMAKKTASNGKTGVKKLNRKKDTIRDLDAQGKGRSVKGSRNPSPNPIGIPMPYPNAR